jgi:2,4-dienoyl-CoA reductase-like NADH-dependent reductase (Old Yellow Enzyme family)
MTDEVVDVYRKVAKGGVGLIITGDFPVLSIEMFEHEGMPPTSSTYHDVAIEGLGRLVDVVRESSDECKIFAQLEGGYADIGPSDVRSPFWDEPVRVLTIQEVGVVVERFVEGIIHMRELGFHGVQLHAAHGGLLSRFLSPYTNRREDDYGGSVHNRVRVVREICTAARQVVGNYPLIIKVNCTDYVPGGADLESWPDLATEIESAGFDALEISGGMWDCLVRPEEELGFRPVPAPESHTRIHRPKDQSYFHKYAEGLNLDIPVILVGGNRDVDRLEEILREGTVDLIALCRPLISEPDLPQRWLEGRGDSGTDCISCNSCIHDLIVHPGRPEPGITICVFKQDREQHKEAQRWLAEWVEENDIT